MLPFTENEQVLYSAIPEMHRRHQCTTMHVIPDCRGSMSVIKVIIYWSRLETLMTRVLTLNKTVWNNNQLFFLLFFSMATPSSFDISEHLLLCRLWGHIYPQCPSTTTLNNYEDYVQWRKFVSQNNTYLSSGNCCSQIRLTLNMYFCIY